MAVYLHIQSRCFQDQSKDSSRLSVILEIHALGLLLLSPWMVWNLDHFSEFRKILRTCFRTKASSYHKLKLSLGHTNFLPLIHNENKKLSGNSLSAKTLQDVLNIGHCKISSDLQDTIITYYKKKAEKIMHSSFSSLSRPGYGDHVSNHWKVPVASNLEFYRAIITWHIVTDLCYYNDEDLNSKSRNASKNLSDYMFYLLVHCRHMLPVGYGLLTLQDTYDEAKKHFPKKDIKEACRDLLQSNTITPIYNELTKKGGRSVFSYACIIATELLKDQRDREEMWELLAELWIEILSYASAQYCRVDIHVQQLRKGLEFLSHVWLFQARLGWLEQYQGIIGEEEKRIAACHVSGHVVTSRLLEHAESLREETILRRGTFEPRFSGCFLAGNLLKTEDQLFNKLCMALGGIVAEEVLLGKIPTVQIPTGIPRNDYEKTEHVLRNHLHDYGQVIGLMDAAKQRTHKLIEQLEEKVAQIAGILFEKEVIHKEDLVKILGESSSFPINQ